MKDATHKDNFGNLYRVIGDRPKPYCVFYWNPSSKQWFQDLGIDFSHLMKI